MKSLPTLIIGLFFGVVLGYTGSQYSESRYNMSSNAKLASEKKEPLYWVAPMDPNYKRDTPGKSPMGMDLIPIFDEKMTNNNEKKGTVKINPAVENNLGVKTARVNFTKLEPKIETIGYINFDESRLWQTNIRVSGWVDELNVNAVGEKVHKGDVLFRIYSPELVKAQEELFNAYHSGRKTLIKGATNRLYALGIDRVQVEQIINTGQVSQKIAIKAPENGVIASLKIREGGFISPAQTVISAGPLDEVWADIEVFERQSHWVHTDTQAEMTLSSFPGKTWLGKVDYIYPIIDPKTRTLRVRVKFSNENNALKPNMFANVTLKTESDAPVLTIPRESVIRSGGMTRVVLAEGKGTFRSTRIQVGRETADKIEVLAGLSENDRVVTSAQFMIDSESSQRADLSRINGLNNKPLPSVWVVGEVTDVMSKHRMVTINHQPVKEWQWPSMVMNFTFAKDINIENVQKGKAIDFKIQKTESGQYEIIDYTVGDTVLPSELWVNGSINMLMKDFRMLTVHHDAVPQWNWDAGEINFSVDNEIDLSPFSEGQSIRFLVKKSGRDPLLISLEQRGDNQ